MAASLPSSVISLICKLRQPKIPMKRGHGLGNRKMSSVDGSLQPPLRVCIFCAFLGCFICFFSRQLGMCFDFQALC